MGRPRKMLDEQQGNLTTVEKARKQAEEEMSKGSQDCIERPPTWLKNPVAKKEYKTIIKDLKKAPSFLLCDLDINNLAAYCNAYAQYRRVTALIDNLAEDELTVQTKSGEKPNPLISLQTTYSTEMRRYASVCGLTLDSRLKQASAQLKKQESQIESEFGDI